MAGHAMQSPVDGPAGFQVTYVLWAALFVACPIAVLLAVPHRLRVLVRGAGSVLVFGWDTSLLKWAYALATAAAATWHTLEWRTSIGAYVLAYPADVRARLTPWPWSDVVPAEEVAVLAGWALLAALWTFRVALLATPLAASTHTLWPRSLRVAGTRVAVAGAVAAAWAVGVTHAHSVAASALLHVLPAVCVAALVGGELLVRDRAVLLSAAAPAVYAAVVGGLGEHAYHLWGCNACAEARVSEDLAVSAETAALAAVPIVMTSVCLVAMRGLWHDHAWVARKVRAAVAAKAPPKDKKE